MRAAVSRVVSQIVTSPTLRGWSRGRHALWRVLTGGRPTVHYFHQPDDPYSHLAVQALPALKARYRIALEVHVVSAPDQAAAPEAAMLRAFAERDAQVLAKGLQWPPKGLGDPVALPSASQEALAQGDALRRRLGHYLGAMFYFEGEWYWGLDRLAFLEERLAPFRVKGAPSAPIAPRLEVRLGAVAASSRKPVLHAFISFRSPYTYLSIPRLRALADHYGAELRLRFVLPMVMRGLPVPRAKQLYILTDCKREAERLGLPFGKVADPVGAGAERGLAVLHHAIPAGQGPAFAQSFLSGVFAEGIDAASDAGLASLATRAGVSASIVKAALADPSWRDVVEANRREMFGGGAWGVPSFRVNEGATHWGQDRLWAVEQDLQRALAGGLS